VYIYDKSSLNSSQNEKCSKQICRENQNTYFVFKTFSVNRPVYVTMWKKYCTTGQATDDSMAHAHCMLDTEGYKHTLKLCNIISFPLQKCLHALVTILSYVSVACLVLVSLFSLLYNYLFLKNCLFYLCTFIHQKCRFLLLFFMT
jgi:hypothetical protein